MSKRHASSERSVVGFLSVVAFAAVSGGCGSSESSVAPRVELVDRTSQALEVGTVKWINGTYTNCTNRTGSWSARITGSDPMNNVALTVVNNDTACTLTLTGLVASYEYLATPPIPLSNAYQSVAAAFAGPSDPVLFYGNAKLSALTFATNFDITVLYSDNLADASPDTHATYATVSSDSNSAVIVDSPDYTTDFQMLVVAADATQVVQNVSGTVGLIAGTDPGGVRDQHEPIRRLVVRRN